jgi:hypothetical protein
MQKHNPAQYTPYHEMIARRARAIWEKKGQPHGRDVEHWLEAEQELAKESGREPAAKLVTTPSNAGPKKR